MILLWIAGGMLAAVLIVKASAPAHLLGEQTVLVIVVGLLAGLLGATWQTLTRRIGQLERRLAKLQHPGPREPGEERDDVAHKPVADGTEPSADTAVPMAPESPSAQPAEDIPSGRPAPPRPETGPPTRTGWLEAHARAWLKRGNLPVIAGVVASLIGVAALLRYAGEQGWLHFPIELRLSLIALAACGLLAFGWTQRHRRRLFSLSLQGGAIGILIMTVFAALRLYRLLPEAAAFALMIVLVGATLVLALVQHALALAVLALVAGFAAPILIGSGEGSHVVLFSWYLVLNLAVFAVAWRRHWPLLYRLGFAFTFVLATLWGVLDYHPAFYASVQGFLVAFFALYAAIPLMQAMAGRDHGRPDVMLVFGLPLVAFPLQMLLLDLAELPVAMSSLSVAALYLLTAAAGGPRLRGHPLRPALLALAVGFATLAVPFAFSGPVIPLVWAAEGAALVWLGLVRDHRWSRRAGLALQLLAGAAWWAMLDDRLFADAAVPVLNGPALGALAVVAAALFSLLRYLHADAGRVLLNLLAGWALGWWLLIGAVEIIEHGTLRVAPDLWLGFNALTLVLLARLARATGLLLPAIAVLALLLAAPLMIPLQIVLHDRVYDAWGLPAWLALLAGGALAERMLAALDLRILRGLIAVAGHLALTAAGAAIGWQLAGDTLALGAGWQWAGLALAPLAIAALARGSGRSPLVPATLPVPQQSWPLRTMQALVLVWLLGSLGQHGASAPLPFVPVLNPLDLASVAGLLVLTGAGNDRAATAQTRAAIRLAIAVLAALVVSVMWLRTAHHWLGVDWRLSAMTTSGAAQAGLSILWTLIGTSLWVAGSRRARAPAWRAGAVLLALVLIKLVAIDRQYLSTLAGIVSFLAFGGLLMLVGYLAPAPPAGGSDRAPATETNR